MNILFVNYGDLRSNSLSHISAYAAALAARGQACAIVADAVGRADTAGPTPCFSYSEALQRAELFPDGRPADLIHAWTPRENVRRFVEAYRQRHASARLIVHLEDNEEAVLESHYQTPIEKLREPRALADTPAWHPRLSHPTEYIRFLCGADAATLLAPSLARFLPSAMPRRIIAPIHDQRRFEVSRTAEEIKAAFHLPRDSRLIVFPGGITSANREDVRALYLATKLLNDDGVPTRVVKTGPSCELLERTFPHTFDGLRIDLGLVDEAAIPELLSIADGLVQPGRDNAFNRDRFPCKIPEFLLSGRPCVIPALYSRPHNIRTNCCLFLRESSPREIADRCQEIFVAPALAEELGRRGRDYAARRFAEKPNAESLLRFYQSVVLPNAAVVAARAIRRALSEKREPPPRPAVPPEHPCFHREYNRYQPIQDRQRDQFLNTLRAGAIDLGNRPKISILLPVYNVADRWLRCCIESVLEQAYPNWELCIADDASPAPHVRATLDEYAARDPRIKVVYRETNGHISRATNSAFALATGEYIALLDHDDEIPPHALARVAETIAKNPQAKIIYSDEDKIDENGVRHGPHFKSDWNYDLFLGCNMISHLGVYRRAEYERAGGFRAGFEGAQDWDLALRVSELCMPGEIVHIPEVLYHWRSIEGSTARDHGHKDYAHEAQRRAIASHLERREIAATLESVEGIHWRVVYPLPDPPPRVSIIVPTRDRADLLAACASSVLEKTTYPNFEFVVIDNASREPETFALFDKLSKDSRVRIVRDEGVFNFSRLNNRVIAGCDSEVVCLLNNDTEVITPGWLREMVSHALRPEIGTVGAKLLFPHEHVQHGGVILGIGGVAAHAFKFLHRDDDGYIHRAQIVSGFSAVTGACMVFRKRIWEEVGGLDEEHLAIAYNDVDFCLKAGQLGYRSLVTPFALLYHKESESRGQPATEAERARFASEVATMHERWGALIARDPYYNPNLTRSREDFSYKLE